MTTLGKYELHEQLGKGGFGTVYRAMDDIGRVVAVKVLKAGFADDQDVIDRFRCEAMAAGSLFHQHIATILDFGESEGRLYIAMRYVDGQPLDKIIKERGKLPWDEAVEIITQVGEALDFAHKKGFIHRDIKPGNILIGSTDGAVLTDFGLVKAVTTSGMSTTGVMLGTPAYIAPEIWSGKEATPATDVYSLACVFFEMLTGKVLFDGESTPEIMKKHFDPIELPEKWSVDVPAGIDKILRKALEIKYYERYQNVSDFCKDIEKNNILTMDIPISPPSIPVSMVHLVADNNTPPDFLSQDPPPIFRAGLDYQEYVKEQKKISDIKSRIVFVLGLTLNLILLITFPKITDQTLLIIYSICVLIMWIVTGILLLNRLYQGWELFKDYKTGVTPEKVIGFLIIPFYNLIWMFTAIFGLSKEINKYSKRNNRPIFPENEIIAMIYCVWTLLVTFVSLFLYIEKLLTNHNINGISLFIILSWPFLQLILTIKLKVAIQVIKKYNLLLK